MNQANLDFSHVRVGRRVRQGLWFGKQALGREEQQTPTDQQQQPPSAFLTLVGAID